MLQILTLLRVLYFGCSSDGCPRFRSHKGFVTSFLQIFSKEFTSQVCLIWAQSIVWYLKWWLGSSLKHNKIHTRWKVFRASFWNIRTVICVTYLLHIFLWLQRTLSEMCDPLCTHHVVTYTALSNSQKVSKHTGRKVEVCAHGCLCVGMCLCACIIVYVWAFVYVYMVLFVWVGLCVYVWPFRQCKLPLQESCTVGQITSPQ